MMMGFIKRQTESDELMKQQIRSQQATIQNMERDMSRLSQVLAERTPGTLPSNAQEKSRKQDPQTSYSQVKVVETTESSDDIIRVRDELHRGSRLEVFRSPTLLPSSARPEEHNCKSLTLTNDICVNVPLVDVISGMPKYGNFIKGLMEKEGEHEQASTAFLTAECDAIAKKRAMPPKLGDPGPFIIPCQLDGSGMLRALADSGACINVMPYSLYTRLNLGDLAPSKTGVRFFDKVVSSPVGIAENVVVKVGELDFLADFVVVDIEEDESAPIVLGRPFLATTGALIDVKAGKLTLRDRGKQLSFQTRVTTSPLPTPTPSVFSVLTAKKVKPNKCGGVDHVLVSKPPDDETLSRSMRRLYSRVHRAMSENDENLRTRLVSNLSRAEKDKLFVLIEEARAADGWLLSMIGFNADAGSHSHGEKKGGYHHPGIS